MWGQSPCLLGPKACAVSSPPQGPSDGHSGPSALLPNVSPAHSLPHCSSRGSDLPSTFHTARKGSCALHHVPIGAFPDLPQLQKQDRSSLPRRCRGAVAALPRPWFPAYLPVPPLPCDAPMLRSPHGSSKEPRTSDPELQHYGPSRSMAFHPPFHPLQKSLF